MYIPTPFAETDQTKLHDFIERYSFGVLVSQIDGQPFASHLPFLIERDSGPHGRLVGHMARANQQWKEADGQMALVIFTGPHAYISPTLYDAEQVVPTWNYVAVHVYGPLQVLDDRHELRDIVEKMVQVYEQAMPRPWSLGGSAAYAERRLAEIVGFCIPIERLEGKWKLNQNHPVERREKVIHALEQRDDENSRAIAAWMKEMIPAGD
jgi:transcriptional regulator